MPASAAAPDRISGLVFLPPPPTDRTQDPRSQEAASPGSDLILRDL